MTAVRGILHPHLQREALFDVVVAVDDAAHGVVHVVALDLGEEPDVAHVDAEHRSGALAHELGRAQDRAVAAEHDREFDVADRHVDAERGDLPQQGERVAELVAVVGRRAPAARPPRAAPPTTRCGGGDGVVAVRVRDDQDAALGVGHGLPASRFTVLNHSVGLLPRPGARCAMNSALPCVPAIGEETTPQVPEPLVPRRPQHARDGVGAGRGIRHESALDRGAADLELRLHQQHEVGVGGGHRARGRQHVRERDEREIAGDELRGRRRRRSPRARLSGVM